MAVYCRYDRHAIMVIAKMGTSSKLLRCLGYLGISWDMPDIPPILTPPRTRVQWGIYRYLGPWNGTVLYWSDAINRYAESRV